MKGRVGPSEDSLNKISLFSTMLSKSKYSAMIRLELGTKEEEEQARESKEVDLDLVLAQEAALMAEIGDRVPERESRGPVCNWRVKMRKNNYLN